MTKPSISARMLVRFLCALIVAAGAAAQEVPTILEVEFENFVLYVYDVTDHSKLARSPGPVTPSSPTLANFATSIGIADVTTINGSPAKGVLVVQVQGIALTPAPTSGQAISDVTRNATVFHRWEFLKPDGSQIGNIFTSGLSGGPPPPGSPLGSTSANVAVIGGTGAFIGAKGTLNQVQVAFRSASQAEDPSMRRTNGGEKGRVLFQIWPMFRPEVVVTPAGPTVFHSDWSPVTSEKPARSGETLMVFAKGLGPTSPGVNPGDPFPGQPLAVVTSPVEVLVDGKASPAINQVGVSGTTDTYRVDFRVPD